MKRRDFVKLSGVATASVIIVPPTLQGCMDDMNMARSITVKDGTFDVGLPIPDEVGTTVPLTTQSGFSAVMKGKTTGTLTYQNNILGPTIRTTNGQTVNATLQNNLSEETNIHWHGLKVPSNMDGHPKDLAQAGGSFNYVLPIDQRAGTYWYHPHPDKKTGKQVHAGLAGMFIVNDSEEAALNLPSGANELPLIIQDKRFSGDQLSYAPAMNEVMTGYLGETVIVNGVASPVLAVATCWYRFRVLNASTARVYNIALSNGADLTIIGNDGGLLSSPVKVKEILLAPGERADILVNFAGVNIGAEVFLISKTFNGGSAQGTQQFKIMKFSVATTFKDSFNVPTSLSAFTPVDPGSSSNTRSFDIGAMAMGGMIMKGMHTINGKTFDMERVDETVQAGATEIWEFDNSTGDEIHPMHIHGVQFQIIHRKGGRNRLIASEMGWKDTVLLMPGEKVGLIMTFPQYRGKFVFHCHNLEHEDDGMMLNYEIV